MFTGLVTEKGEVKYISRGESSAVFTIDAPKSTKDLSIGDSIAVNGVCLTVVELDHASFKADVMVQTLSLTSMGQLHEGSHVNLELAAQLDMRLGGHIVQGHIDGVAKVSLIQPGERWLQMDLHIPAKLQHYVVAQGSITVDGVSLTVGSMDDEQCKITVWLIPETLEKTNLSEKKVGDEVNIEVDILAKYVERIMSKKSTAVMNER